MLVALLMYNCSVYISPLDQHVSNHLSLYTPVPILLGGKETPVLQCNSIHIYVINMLSFKVIPEFCIAHSYCA